MWSEWLAPTVPARARLLRILAGDLEPLDGAVTVAPADAFVGWLPQEHERVPGETVAA